MASYILFFPKKNSKGRKFSSYDHIDQTDPFSDKTLTEKPSTPDSHATSDDGNKNESSKPDENPVNGEIVIKSSPMGNSQSVEEADSSKRDLKNTSKTSLNGSKEEDCAASGTTYSSADGSKDGVRVDGSSNRGSSKEENDDTSGKKTILNLIFF